MKKSIQFLVVLISMMFVIGCSGDNDPVPVNSVADLGVAGFNGVSVTSEFDGTVFIVYSGKPELANDIYLYTDIKMTLYLLDGKYRFDINEVFYNTFNIVNGRVSNLDLLTN